MQGGWGDDEEGAAVARDAKLRELSWRVLATARMMLFEVSISR